MKTFLFTSESVGDGHPDKICDQISDAILDAHLEMDPESKVAIETIVKNDTVILVGEISSTATINYHKIVKNTIKEIGYNFKDAFNYQTVNILTFINKQSADISKAVIKEDSDEMGAGDQGIMFGYATDECEELMPISLIFSHRIVQRIQKLRKEVNWMRPDCKSQVSIEYAEEDGALIPLRVDNIVVSLQHDNTISIDELRVYVIDEIIKKVIPMDLLETTKFYVQPSGQFIIGGPIGDSGLTGRKIIVDTYGGFGAHGGGCFSGKDCSKVDRSGAYAARWIAKSLVANGVCKRVIVQLSYAIGMKDPLSVFVNTYGTGSYSDEDILAIIEDNFDLRPGAIIKKLGLKSPIFRKTATFGHFGRNEFSWETPITLKLRRSPPLEK